MHIHMRRAHRLSRTGFSLVLTLYTYVFLFCCFSFFLLFWSLCYMMFVCATIFSAYTCASKSMVVRSHEFAIRKILWEWKILRQKMTVSVAFVLAVVAVVQMIWEFFSFMLWLCACAPASVCVDSICLVCVHELRLQASTHTRSNLYCDCYDDV